MAGLWYSVALALGAALRLWQLGTRPNWQYDEAIYTRIAANVLQHGTLNEHIITGTSWQPFLFQPPFYFLILARWFALMGVGIAQARVLGVLMSLAMLTTLFKLIWKVHGPRIAMVAIVPTIFDGWMLCIERVSYMENGLLLIIVCGLALYQKALERQSVRWFALAGAVLGFAVVFKHTGVYILLSVMLCWLITGRAHRGHSVLLVVALAVISIYVIAMARLFDVPGHDWYLQESAVQLRRTFGLQSTGGTLTSPTAFLHLITSQYSVFIPSLAVAVFGAMIALRRVWQCYRARNWAPLQGNALLFSWLAAGLLVFGLSALKYPQYFAVILLPLYAFAWTEIARWKRPFRAKATAVALVTLLGIGMFYLRVTDGGNALAEMQQYAASSIPKSSVVVTEETFGNLISQPWCRIELASQCPPSVTYAITWKTYLQSSFDLGGSAFARLMEGATPVESFSCFSGTATVWRLR